MLLPQRGANDEDYHDFLTWLGPSREGSLYPVQQFTTLQEGGENSYPWEVTCWGPCPGGYDIVMVSVRALGLCQLLGLVPEPKTYSGLVLGAPVCSFLPSLLSFKPVYLTSGSILSRVSSISGSSLSLPRILKVSFLKQPQRKGGMRWGWGVEVGSDLSFLVESGSWDCSNRSCWDHGVGGGLRIFRPLGVSFRLSEDGNYG